MNSNMIYDRQIDKKKEATGNPILMNVMLLKAKNNNQYDKWLNWLKFHHRNKQAKTGNDWNLRRVKTRTRLEQHSL